MGPLLFFCLTLPTFACSQISHKDAVLKRSYFGIVSLLCDFMSKALKLWMYTYWSLC